MATDIFLQWDIPQKIGPVLELVNSYLEKQSLFLRSGQFPGLISVRYEFDVDSNDTQGGFESYYVKNPWRRNSNLLRSGFRHLSATYFNIDGDEWFSVSTSIGEGGGCPYNGVKNGGLILLRIILNEEIIRVAHSPKDAAKMISIYAQCKELFTLLNCDAVDCYSEGFGSLYWPDPDPDHENKVFRFAKNGRQVRVQMFEDGLPIISRDKTTWREVIDP